MVFIFCDQYNDTDKPKTWECDIHDAVSDFYGFNNYYGYEDGSHLENFF